MLIRKILPILILLFVCNICFAQSNKGMPTSRILKTATSLMEAQQYEAAEEYFKKGMAQAKAGNEPYNLAQAQEGLGNLYSKINQSSLAVEYYQKAIKMYRAQGLTVIANVVESLMKGVQGIGELYAGVEIGGKGIKLSVIEVKMTRTGENEYVLKADTSINTDAAALSYQSEKETYDAVSIFYDIIKTRFKIPSARIHIVISSGLKQELDKYNKVAYFANIVRPRDLDSQIRINYITPAQESEMSFRGIVPQRSRLIANQLDVGSSNTKGGYFDAMNNFVPVTFPLGTKTFQRLVEKTADESIDEFLSAAEKIIADSLGRVMVYEFLNKRDFKSRDVLYLSGGIVWAIASCMHPQQINDNFVEITQKDIADFRDKVYNGYSALVKPDLSKTMKPDDANASIKNIGRVVKTYDQKALLAGAIWLDELIQQVNTVNPSKKLLFPRYAYVGWISGYIMDKINKQYTGLAKN
ncbi:MAG: tetratricopeptide repeat protein [Rhizobacter sp.]|nr:tetratricopeptide repeat protein [Ferruginibacter sp.]